MENSNSWLVSHFIACAERKIETSDKIESVTGNVHDKLHLGGELSEIKLFDGNKCRISFYLYDRAIEESDFAKSDDIYGSGLNLKEEDRIEITVINEGERFIAFTQKELEEISENYEEVLGSISEQGKVYICGNETGKDENFNIYARILDWDKGKYGTDVVRLERFQRKGKMPLKETVLDLDSFCRYYRLANEEERKEFEKNHNGSRDEREM